MLTAAFAYACVTSTLSQPGLSALKHIHAIRTRGMAVACAKKRCMDLARA